MPITRDRLEAYWRETLSLLPTVRDKAAVGWRLLQFAVVPPATAKARWLVMTCQHTDGEKLKVTVPLSHDDLTPKVVTPAIIALATLRGVLVSELTAQLAEPITFTASSTCSVCHETDTTSAVDRMPLLGGSHCARPECRSVARRERFDAANPSLFARPLARASDAERLAEHNRRWGGE